MPGQFNYYVRRARRAMAGVVIRDTWRKKVYYLSDEYPGEFIFKKGFLHLTKFDCQIQQDEFYFILERYDVLRILKDKLNAKITIREKLVSISFNGLTFNPTTAEELFILEEVYVSGAYNFVHRNPVVVIDVGMNVGFASLFFAQHQQVNAVHSFEPFNDTFRQALKNIELNPSLSGKIFPVNVGLGTKEEQLTVDYNYENKGQVGVYGTSLIRSEIDQSEKVVISIKPVGAEFRKIFEKHPQQRFALKLDCEGAEYEILKSLASENLLNQFDMIFIEWHEKGPHELLTILQGHHFSAIHQQASTKNVGMIYAIRFS